MSNGKYLQVLSLFISATILALMLLRDEEEKPIPEHQTDVTQKVKTLNPLDGCLHVFLDVGSNRGIQIRKVYEPHLFPTAGVLPIFDKYFGNIKSRNLTEICSVGFEPNPLHQPELDATAAALRSCQYNVIIHTLTGVGNRNGGGTVGRIPVVPGLGAFGNEVAARVIDPAKDYGDTLNQGIVAKANISVIKLARYINEVVATRQLPPSAKTTKPRVVMKMDIEGAELEVLPDMIMEGSLKHIDNIHADWTRLDPYVDCEAVEKLRQAVEFIVSLAVTKGSKHICEISGVDDESYGDAKFPFPSCPS